MTTGYGYERAIQAKVAPMLFARMLLLPWQGVY